ncbi:MAG: hypothetical protein MUP74_00880, partial [Desulfobacterales bacterium]|nr:hypothetical protein [Desulfobacterales bacterium]
FIRNPTSEKLVERTTALSPDFFKGQPVALNPELLDIERRGFAQLVENDPEGSLILGGEASGRIHDLPTVRELIVRIAADAERIVRALPDLVVEHRRTP